MALAALSAGVVSTPAVAQSWAFLDVVKQTNLDFGVVPQGKGLISRPRSSPDIAKFKITGSLPAAGTGQRVVTLTFQPPANLLGPNGGMVPYVMMGAYNSMADDQATASVFMGTALDIPLQILEGYQNNKGIYSAYVYVYGNVTVSLSVPVGSYIGDINLVAEPTSQTGGTGSTGCNLSWNSSVWYNDGDWVEYQNNAWRALWWNAGNIPGSGGGTDPWEAMGPCSGPEEGPGCQAFAYSPTKIYNDGDWATYNAKAWRASYYIRDQVPGSAGSTGSWEEMGPCDGSPWDGTGCAALPWAVSRIYHGGEHVTYNGRAYQSTYYTRGSVPGSGGWSQIQICSS